MQTKETVLIIEDDSDINELFCEIFESANYNILQAPNGQVALDILTAADLKNTYPDIILIDMLMPILNGMEFIAIINAKYPETLAKLPYIITSAKDYSEMSDLKLPDNFTMMKKPMDIDDLLKKAKEHSNKYKLKRP